MFDSDVNFREGMASARKLVSGSAPFALGHYPADPIFPGVLALELMLRLGEHLLRQELGREPVKTRIVRVQYLGMIRPGDELTVTAARKRTAVPLRIGAQIMVGDVVKTRATFDYQLEA